MSILPLLRGLSSRRCPMSLHFLTRWVSMLLELTRVSWAFVRVGIHNLSHFDLHISMFFHSLFFTCHWISFVLLLYDWCICTHRSTLHLLTFSVSFQAWDWLWYLMLWSQRRSTGSRGAHWQKSSFKFLPWRGLNRGPCSLMAANFTIRLCHGVPPPCNSVTSWVTPCNSVTPCAPPWNSAATWTNVHVRSQTETQRNRQTS